MYEQPQQQPSEPRPPADVSWTHDGPPSQRQVGATVIGLCVLGVLALGLALSFGIAHLARGDASTAAAAVEQGPTQLETAVDLCASDPHIRIGDGGYSLTIDGAGHYSGADFDVLTCILVHTDVPDSVKEQIYSTRALDGMQRASWPVGYEAFWTYHPDDGVNMTITLDQ